MSATFLNTLIPLAQRDLRGSGKNSAYSNFSILSYPDSDDTCIGFNCNFGQVNSRDFERKEFRCNWNR